MSFRIKVPSKKSPLDEAHLLGTMDRFWLAAEEHRRGIAVGFVVVLLAAGVVAGVLWYDAQQTRRAMELHVEANKFYAARPEDRPEAVAKNLKQAIALYRQVVREYPAAPAAAQSLYRLGLALEESGSRKEAVEAYQKLADSYGDNGALLGLAYQRLGYAHLEEGDAEKAARAFASVLTVPGANNKDHALFELAKLEERQGRPEGALARYEELMEQYPQSALASEVAIRLRALGAKPEAEAEAEGSASESERREVGEPEG